ncbi:MAG: GTPase Era [Candidatus Zhuqueibacterota bacterium]
MTPSAAIDPAAFKSGYIALIGRPNVGKSTLMNALLGQKLSIVTPKPQTTRHRVLGILSEENFQMIFLDTPGLLIPKYKLQETMVQAAKSAIEESDVLLFLVEPEAKVSSANASILTDLIAARKPVVLVINKVDAIEKDRLLPLMQEYSTRFSLQTIVPISALKLDGLDELKQVLIQNLLPGLPFYPMDMVTEHPERFFVAEIIREKVFQRFSAEIPYSTTVVVEEFKEREAGKDFISATIIVERNSQKGILIGKKGAALKQVGQLARKEIEEMLDRPVFLELYVKVKEKWRTNDSDLRQFGYK